jgi:NAD(P)-dependent dehydrogenase (short-subunit alcohol dehydrogenase family)
MDFRDRHIVVSGGAGALGTAVVEALAGAGAICHVPCLHEAEKQSCRLQESKNVRLAVAGNLADEAVVARFYQAMAPMRDTTAALLRQQLDMNFVSCALCCRAAVSAMTAGGRIVNVSARPGLEWRSGAGMVAYTASKAAVAALTAALAEEVAKDGILVNAVAPSIMDTPANRQAMPKADYALWPKVEEVAATIVFLASPDNRVTRGAIVSVYGKS